MTKHGLVWAVILGVIVLMFLNLPPIAAKRDSVVHTYSALVEVDALARQRFVEPVHDDRLVDGAIQGMMRRLDPYSGYISPHELPGFERRSAGQYIGVGLEVGMRGGAITVIAPIEGSPASRAGLYAGDTILAIDGLRTDELSVFDVKELLVGQPGTRVEVLIRRGGEVNPRLLKIERGPVTLRTVRGVARTVDGNWELMFDPASSIGYIRVSGFRANTIGEFDRALRELRKQQVRGLVLDLRFNPGGMMQQAVAMVDRFVDDGLILSTVTRRKAIKEYYATAGSAMPDIPLVVLINSGSASSSEIVAGSLQSHKRAVIVGERSFGKGSVQHLIHLTGQAAAVKLTVAYYRLPDGRIIHRRPQTDHEDTWGVQPDVEILLSSDQVRAIQEARRTLDLAPVSGSQALGSAGDEPSVGTPGGRILRDRQLKAALDVIRGKLLQKVN